MRVIIFFVLSLLVLSCSSDNTDYSPMIAPIDQRAVKEKEDYLKSIRTKDSLLIVNDTASSDK